MTPHRPLSEHETTQAPREVKPEKRAAARAAFRLAATESRAVCATCGYAHHVARFYRCRWCGVYFCNACSYDHFAPDATHEGAAFKAEPATPAEVPDAPK